jgi:DNA repair exonuclease SbcCD ATPase subunit
MVNLTNIEQSIKSLESNVSSLHGKLELLEKQYTENVDELEHLKELQVTNAEAIELLNMVQKTTKEKIQSAFETIITHALNYVYNSSEYQFGLEFARHGNNPKMNFSIKTPDLAEIHDIMNTRAGGEKDIVALALRLVLLEVSRNKGLLFLDEPDKQLDNEETEQRMLEFIKENQKASKRQILIITHKQSIVDAVPDPILFKKEK